VGTKMIMRGGKNRAKRGAESRKTSGSVHAPYIKGKRRTTAYSQTLNGKIKPEKKLILPSLEEKVTSSRDTMTATRRLVV